jgi:hypothetical protein
MQRLASSLGFTDIHEAQATIDTTDMSVSYKDCFELIPQLEKSLSLERAEVTRLSESLRVVEEENETLKASLQGSRCE